MREQTKQWGKKGIRQTVNYFLFSPNNRQWVISVYIFSSHNAKNRRNWLKGMRESVCVYVCLCVCVGVHECVCVRERGGENVHDLVPKGVQEKRTEVLEDKVDRMWVMQFLNEHMWSLQPVKGEGSAALRSWEIWLSVWFVTKCWTLHITTSPQHCAAYHAVNCGNPTDLTRCDPHEYYQVNCCCSVSHRTACYAWFVATDNV